MQAVWAVARGSLRRGISGTMALVVLIGLVGGAVLAAAAGGRRTDTALERFLAFSREPHVGANVPLALADAVERLPMVETAARQTYVPLGFPDLPEDDWENLVPFVSLDDRYGSEVARPMVLSGARPSPTRVDEAAVSAALAEKRSLRPGSTLRARTFTPDDLARAEEPGEYRPSGPEVRLRVTGVVRVPADLAKTDDEGDFISGEEMLYLTPAFWRTHVAALPRFGEQAAVLVRLRGGPADTAVFRAGVERANGGPFDGEDFGVYEFGQETAKADRALSVQAVTIYLFAALASIAGLFVVGQAVARQLFVESAHVPALRSLGMGPRQLFGAAIVRMSVVAVASAAAAAVIAIAVSSRFPFGLGRAAEPHPGSALNAAVVIGGAAILAMVVLALAVWPAWVTTRSHATSDATTRSSRFVAALARAGASPTALTGVRMALDPGRGAGSVPVRVSMIGAVVGVAALAAALTFGASLDRLAETPRLQGVSWDTIVEPDEAAGPDVRERLAAHPMVAEVSAAATTDATVNDDPVVVVGLERASRELWPPLLDGRYPNRSGEIVLGSRGAQELGLDVGERLTLRSDGGPLVVRVVGTVVFPDILLADRTGEGVVAPIEDVRRLSPDAAESFDYYVTFSDGVEADAADRALAEEFGGSLRPYQPADVRNVVRVSAMPFALAGLLVFLGLATLAHTLVSAVRRRRRELALLKTVGFVRSQVARTVAWQTSTLVVVGLVVGLPIGVAAGRWAWLAVAGEIGVLPRSTVPVLALAAAVPLGLAVGNLVAAGPSAVAARTAPAVVLRAE